MRDVMLYEREERERESERAAARRACARAAAAWGRERRWRLRVHHERREERPAQWWWELHLRWRRLWMEREARDAPVMRASGHMGTQ